MTSCGRKDSVEQIVFIIKGLDLEVCQFGEEIHTVRDRGGGADGRVQKCGRSKEWGQGGGSWVCWGGEM